MSEGVDAPMVRSVVEGQCLEDIRPIIANGGENGTFVSNSDGNSSPESETSFNEEGQPSKDDLQSSPSGESFGAINDDDDESRTDTTSSGSSARMEDETFDGDSANWFGGWQWIGGKEISFSVDYVFYESTYSTNWQLTFTESVLEARSQDASGDEGDLCIRLRLDEIERIESIWAGTFQTAKVKIYAPPESKDVETDSRFTGTKLEFTVMDPDWCKTCQAIRSLGVRYGEIWKVANDSEMEEYGDTLGQMALPFQTSYFPEFRPFEDFIYPKGDADAVTVGQREVDLLQPDTFVNDTIIDFYIKYLKDKLHPEKRQRFHFFNSFFFRKLADLEKYPPGSFDGKAAFLRVRKWTRKVNLFEKDFIFIPVNHNYHWSLLVICHPGEVANFRDEDAMESARVPCILHMDSIRGTHGDLRNRIQSYLCEEWKGRQSETSEDVSSKFSNLRFVSLELPQQKNSYDCGLFLLHYVELFLEEDPVSISPFKITSNMKFLTEDWFPSSEPSLKRREILKLIYDQIENHSGETSPTHGNDNCHSKAEIAMKLPSESKSKHCDVNLEASQAETGLVMTPFSDASLLGSHCASDTGLVSVEHFESNSSAGSSVNMQYRGFNRMPSFSEFKSDLESIEEDVGNIENFVYSASKEKFHHLDEVTPETRDYACSSRDLRTEASWNQGSSIHQTEMECQNGLASLAVKSALYSEVQDGKHQVAEDIRLDENVDLIRHVPAGNVQSLTDGFAPVHSAVLDFADPHFSKPSLHSEDTLSALKACSMPLPDILKRGMECVAGVAYNDADAALALEEVEGQHAVKRPRVTPCSEGEHEKPQPEEDLCL